MGDLDFTNLIKNQHKIEFDSNKHFMKDNIIHCKVCGEPLEIVRGATKIPLVCSCYEKQEKARKMRENEQKRKDYIKYLRSISMVGKRFENANFNDIDKNHNKSYLQACSRCENYCNKSNEMLENGFGIYIYGSCGGGKTYLTACMANKLLEKAHSVLFTNFMEISRMIRNTYDTSNDENESEVIERIKNVDFLFIDDFGTEKVAKGGEENWLQEKIYDIINSRYIDLKPVIFSSNYSIEQLAERGFMEKTIDRVSEMSTAIMKIQEKNFRKKRKGVILMKFKEFKPVYPRILLYATTYDRKYVKVLGVGTKSDFEKYFDANLLTMIDNSKLQTTKVLILDDPKYKGQIIKGKGWLYDL